MIEVGEHAAGAVLRVRAQPRARRARIVGEHAGAIKVAVTEPPERGKANQAIAEFLAAQLDLPRGTLTLITGATSKEKRFLVTGLSPTDLRSRLRQIIAGTAP